MNFESTKSNTFVTMKLQSLCEHYTAKNAPQKRDMWSLCDTPNRDVEQQV